MLEVLNLGYPIVIGMETYEGFMELDQTNSVISMPESDTEMLGGHAMTIVGYSLPHQQFLAKNSFGEDWGADGYCWMPFDYVKKYVFERWVFEI
jgi:C1A family cysteine protease